MNYLSVKNSLKIIAITIVIIGPLVAALQIQFGSRAGLKSAAERNLSNASLHLKQAEFVRDVSQSHQEDVLLIESAVPLGESHETLLATLADVASAHGGRVANFNLHASHSSITELQLSRYKSNMENFEVVFNGIDYEKVSPVLVALTNSRRPIKIDKWDFDSRSGNLTVVGRIMFIEEYVVY